MHATLVVMAAGMGSRYGGDKQVDGVGPHGEILMNYGIYDAARAGFDKVVFVIKPEIRDLIRRLAGDALETLHTPDGRKVEFCYAQQTFDSIPDFYHIPEGRTKPFGTAQAVLCTRGFVNEPFCVINADDYYGVDAYRTMYQALQALREEGEATMVGYLLKNTVTRYGTVSRGVCRTAEGKLTDIHEVLKIRQLPDGTIEDVTDGQPRPLAGDSVVSMNFWGFMPSIYGHLERHFHDFLRTAGDDPKVECLLPNIIGELMNRGELTVSVLHSADQWFGMTYQEDRPRVAAALQALHDAGVYPEKLA